MNRSLVLWSAALTALVCIPSTVRADPYPDQILKFQQLPMIATPIPDPEGTLDIYYGHDELSTAWTSDPPDPTGQQPRSYSGYYMADDFADRFNTPVVHLRWWGSYMGSDVDGDGDSDISDAGFGLGVQQFLISWETDVPVGPENPVPWSHPGLPLLSEVVDRAPVPPLTPPAGFFTEMLVPGSSPTEPVYEYNAELACPFFQEPDTVYWLKIVALVDVPRDGFIEWGWHNRDYTIPDPLASTPPAVVPGEFDAQPIVDPGYPTPVWHFQDDAVTGSLFTTVFAPCEVFVEQPEWFPTFYLDDVDGPGPTPPFHGGIGQFSKDLAFELWTVPEPATAALLAVGSLMMIRRRS